MLLFFFFLCFMDYVDKYFELSLSFCFRYCVLLILSFEYGGVIIFFLDINVVFKWKRGGKIVRDII